MITLLLQFQFRAFLHSLKKPWNAFVQIMWIATVWMYAFLFDKVLIAIDLRENQHFTISDAYNLAIGIVLVFGIGRYFFPAYRPLKNDFPSYFPISKSKRFFMSALTDLINPFTFYMLLFVAILQYYSTTDHNLFIIRIIITLFSLDFARKLIQYLLEIKMSIPCNLLIISSLIVFFVPKFYFTNQLIYIELATLILLLGTTYFVSGNHTKKQATTTKQKNNSHTHFYIKLLFQNAQVKVLLLFGFALKLFFFYADFYSFLKKGHHLFDNSFLFYIFASPLVIFTYIFNNTYGFWYSLWQNIEIRSGSLKHYLIHVYKIAAIPVAIDFVLTYPVLMYASDDKIFITVFYFTSALFLVFMAPIWSVFQPKQYKSVLNMKSSTSVFGSILSMAVVVAISTIQYNPWLYLLVPLIFGFVFIAYLYFKENYREQKWNIYKTLK